MKKMIMTAFAFITLIGFAGCDSTVETEKDTTPESTTSVDVADVKVEEQVSIPFAEVGNDIMDAKKEYSLFRFTEPEGTCMEMDFPENLIYKSTNMIMAEDESYFDQGTSVDFAGMIRFRNVPLADDVTANCSIKTTKGINTANLVCKAGEGEEVKEVCTGTYKVTAEK